MVVGCLRKVLGSSVRQSPSSFAELSSTTVMVPLLLGDLRYLEALVTTAGCSVVESVAGLWDDTFKSTCAKSLKISWFDQLHEELS